MATRKTTKAKVTKASPKKASVKRTAIKRTDPKKSSVLQAVVVVLAIIAIVFSLLAAFNPQALRSLLIQSGLTFGMYDEAQISIPNIEEAKTFNIYFKEVSEENYTNTARNVPASAGSYMVSYLNKNVDYVYQLAAVNNDGEEFLWSEAVPLSNNY